MDEWKNGLPDEYEQEEEISEQGRQDLAAEQQEALELELEQDEQRERAVPEPPAKKKLKRELEQEALARLESAARTVPEWNNVIAWWDRLDANRERRERYHEISRSGDDPPIDYGADENGLCFPDMMNTVLEKQRQNWVFIFSTSFLYYEDYDTIDEDTRNLYRQSMAAFDGNAPSYHIALLDKPTIVWDFHSLLLGIQMMFSFMLTDEKTPLRLCRHCMKVFVASRPSNQFCSPECKNRHNVYKNRAKKKENE